MHGNALYFVLSIYRWWCFDLESFPSLSGHISIASSFTFFMGKYLEHFSHLDDCISALGSFTHLMTMCTSWALFLSWWPYISLELFLSLDGHVSAENLFPHSIATCHLWALSHFWWPRVIWEPFPSLDGHVLFVSPFFSFYGHASFVSFFLLSMATYHPLGGQMSLSNPVCLLIYSISVMNYFPLFDGHMSLVSPFPLLLVMCRLWAISLSWWSRVTWVPFPSFADNVPFECPLSFSMTTCRLRSLSFSWWSCVALKLFPSLNGHFSLSSLSPLSVERCLSQALSVSQ